MLTPDKIREKSFQTTGRGSYRAEDVDAFLDEVVASYEQMYNENGDLIKKITLLAKKIEEYRADEDSLKMALLNAQKLADKIVVEAKEKAEQESAEMVAETARLNELAQKALAEAETKANEAAEKIIADANAKAKEMLGNINRTVTHQSLVYEMLQKETSEFKSKLIAMYKEHINLINLLPEIVDEKLNEDESTEPKTVEEAVVNEEPVVVEEAPVVVVEPTVAEEVVEETVADEEPVVVEEAPVEIIEDVDNIEEIVEENSEETVETPSVKKSFKLDLSKIDFADDEDVPEETVIVEDVETDEESNSEADDDSSEGDVPKSISFKNFFKKK